MINISDTNKLLSESSGSIREDSITNKENIQQEKKHQEDKREENFISNNKLLTSTHHPYTINTVSSFHSFYYTNTNTILNKFIMSYEEQLHKAIVKGNYELVNELILRKCNINKQHNRKFPLCLACEHNYYEIAELLIKNGADVNQFDFYDQSCLLYAVCQADLSLIELLVDSGASINKCDSNGNYPLHFAIKRQNDEICDYLIEKGALINSIDKDGNTPLGLAINNDYFYMIDKLLSLGADPNIADNNGDTPLIKTIWLTMSANIERDIITKTVKKLVESGADVNARNESGRTALFTAIYQNNTDIALYLIEKGAKCELTDVLMSNFTLLHYACFQGNYILVKTLLEKKCDPNSIATSCESPVYIAVTKGYLDIVSLLIEYGANVNLFIGTDNDNKCTALQATIYYISDYSLFKNIVNKLIYGNVDLSISEPGPIMYICLQYNKSNFAKYLLSVGADVEQRTVFNQSTFYKAFLNKNLEFMQMCVMAGFKLHQESWIGSYLDNPDFIEYTDYYVKKASSYTNETSENSSGSSSDVEANFMTKTDTEINDLLNLDEYYFERFHSRNKKLKDDKKNAAELARKIFSYIKHYYTNPLSLKEIARIQIRKNLLEVDYKMKFKIENDLPLPNRLKDYLLMKEFNL